MAIGRSKVGLFLILAGIVYLTLPTLFLVSPLSTIRFGEFELSDVSELSAINIFVGISLIAMGIFVNTRQRVLSR